MIGLGLGIGLSFGGAQHAPWTPAKLPGLVLWLEADKAGGVDGANLASWPDLSGAGFDLNVQPAGANVFHASGGPGGKSCVTFSLGPLSRASALVTGADASRTFYMVLKRDSGGHIAMLDGRYGFNGFGYGDGLDLPNKRDILISGATILNDTTSNITNGWEKVGIINVGGASQRLRVGGTEHALSSSATELGSTTRFSIGGNDQGFSPDNYLGSFAEFIGCTGVLSDGDIASVESYLLAKYGV